MKKTLIIISLLILISFAIGIYLLPHMPEKMASHWNSQGQVNGYMTKFWGLFLMPIVSAGMLLLFIFLPMMDPLKKNIEKFRKYFNLFIIFIFLFLFYIYALTLVWNLGYKFKMSIMIIPALAILFYICGILINNAKRNWMIGIRTPWTISNEEVWNKTHQLGGIFFKILALIILLGILFPKQMVWFILVPVIGLSTFLFFYSYFIYRKQKENN